LAAKLIEAFIGIYFHGRPLYTLNLSHQSIRALQYIGFYPQAKVEDVARHLGCASNTASEILSRLADKNLITRQRDKHDERTLNLALTEQGLAILQEHMGLDQAKVESCLRAMTTEQREQMLDSFQTLWTSLVALDTKTPDGGSPNLLENRPALEKVLR